MARGLKKHMKRLNAPKHWMLDKLTGTWAPKPTPGPHKGRECLPLIILLRNRLKYALTRNEVTLICKQRLIQVDGKVRTDINFPAGFMDVITIEKTGENFRLLFDVKGRFAVHRITKEESKYKLCKVRKIALGQKGVPYIATTDGRTIRYPDPDVREHDTVKIDLDTGKIIDYIRYEPGNLVMVNGGRNTGRVGVLEHIEKHPGSFNIAYVKDAGGNQFATRTSNIFIIGKGVTSLVSLPAGKGIKLTILEERAKRVRE
jgi:small subunit ribosomal protein S4e